MVLTRRYWVLREESYKYSARRTLTGSDLKAAFFDAQEKECAICSKPMNYDESAWDHDHMTGFVRGLVHVSCNTMLAGFEWILDNGYFLQTKTYLEARSQDPQWSRIG